MRLRGIAVVCLIIGLAAEASAQAPAAPPAQTQSFDQLSTGAVKLERRDLVGWAWALTATCADGDDMAQRQCKAIRDARAAQIKTQTFVVEAEPDAFMAGAWDPAKRSVTLTVRGCIACAPIEVGGKKLFIVTNKAAPTEVGGTLQAAVIHETARGFDDEKAAEKWRGKAVPRLKIELVFALPQGNPVWTRNGKDGLAVNVLGFRVIDPCDGGVVCSSGGASKQDPDKKACGTVDEGAADQAPAEPTEQIVDQLDPAMIRTALVPTLAKTQECHDDYGVDGQTKIKITIGADGTVLTFEQSGDFDDTPTGECIAKAVKATVFPKSHKKRTPISYPIVLR